MKYSLCMAMIVMRMMMMIVRGCSPAHDDEATDPGVDTGLQGPRDVVRQGLAHPHHQGLCDTANQVTSITSQSMLGNMHRSNVRHTVSDLCKIINDNQ